MLDILRGLAVLIVLCVAIGGPILWWALKTDDTLPENEGGFAPNNDPTQVITIGPEPDVTQVIRVGAPTVVTVEQKPYTTTETALILDVRPIEGGPVVAIDELGEWNPAEHVLEQPLVLGQVITMYAWGELSFEQLGLVAA